MALDLSSISSEDLQQLKALLADQPETTGRSTVRFGKDRQLHDLRLAPAADDPRPLFVWSAETPRDHAVGPGKPFPRLMWHKVTNQEITVKSAHEMELKSAEFTVDPPEMGPIDPQQELADLMAQLSEADRQLLLDSMQQTRMAAIQKQLDALSPDALADVLGRVPGAVETPKRKAGRPRKIA